LRYGRYPTVRGRNAAPKRDLVGQRGHVPLRTDIIRSSGSATLRLPTECKDSATLQSVRVGHRAKEHWAGLVESLKLDQSGGVFVNRFPVIMTTYATSITHRVWLWDQVRRVFA